MYMNLTEHFIKQSWSLLSRYYKNRWSK
jgi:hypothetical protein